MAIPSYYSEQMGGVGIHIRLGLIEKEYRNSLQRSLESVEETRSISDVNQAEHIVHAERLLSLCMYQPTPEKTKSWMERYITESNHILYLYVAEHSKYIRGPIGVIGMRDQTDGRAEIIHIAVDPEARGHGAGCLMIREIVRLFGYITLAAQTDQDAVGFYRACGFQIESLGMLYPGTESFCVHGILTCGERA